MFYKFKIWILQKMINIPLRTRQKIINTNHLVIPDKLIAQMRTDESRSSDHENIFLFKNGFRHREYALWLRKSSRVKYSETPRILPIKNSTHRRHKEWQSLLQTTTAKGRNEP